MDARFRHRFAVAASLALVLAGIGASILYCFPISVSRDIDIASVKHWGGNAYAVPVAQQLPVGIAETLVGVEPDSNESPTVSRLRLLEQGARIGTPHSIHAAIAEKGQGRYSHWDDNLVFSPSDNSDPRRNGRSYALSYPVSPSWWIPLALLVVGGVGLAGLSWTERDDPALRARAGGAPSGLPEALLRIVAKNRRGLFWAGAAMLCLYLNLVFAIVLPAPVSYPDSNGYLTWSLFRTVGYPALLDLYHLVFRNWEYLPLVQLNLLLASLCLLAFAIARVTGSYLIAWLFLALVIGAGNMVLSAADMLTEAAFSAFAMLHIAFAILFFDRGRALWGLLAGLALAAAILVKSVAFVLLGPVILFIAFLPGRRRAVFAMLFCPAVAAWLGPSAYNYARNGFFESSLAGGYALAGHVAWGIRPGPNSAYKEEASAIETRLAPILQRRPAMFDSVDAYVDFTANEYNTLLWRNIVPELASYYGDTCSPEFLAHLSKCSWKSCETACVPTMNRSLLHLSREAIAANPGRYFYHVLAHDYGMWRDMFAGGTNVLRGASDRAELLPAAYDPKAGYRDRLAPLPPFMNDMERAAAVARFEDSGWTRLLDLVTLRQLANITGEHVIHRHPIVMFVLGLVASLLVFRLPRLSPAAKAYCYTGLCLNACILGTSLSQPSLVRYAWTLQGMMAAMLLLGLVVGGRRIAGLYRTMSGQGRIRSNFPWEHKAK